MRPSKALLKTVVDAAPSSFNVPANSTVFSAIQPTGVFHLGNYLGAVRPWVDIAQNAPDSTKLYYATADLHAITMPKEPKQLRQWRHQAIASILASGIDAERCTVYHQSAVPEHTQLNWILSTITGMGSLNRMVQWKSKVNIDESSSLERLDQSVLSKLQLGLFAYPVLQAADILIHKANFVPVGEDQSQHLELSRQITTSFNSRFGEIFPVPRTLLAPYKKIASLRDPSKKMSKSDPDNNSCVYITDEPEVIRKKIRKSVTDSIQGEITYDPSRKGVSNLLMIAAGLLKIEPTEVLTHIGGASDHKQLKDKISDVVIEQLRPVRVEYTRLMMEQGYLEEITKTGTLRARESAAETIKQVYEATGFA
ncbi:tryptophan--tRNA ligase, mitochondrial [Trichomonascus vanleenenianus]|uniref:tryptophan--tRNA ligase MSW1 n=1 Tax=Trichomonascus vanleenenianus TaxID=2268995 RepID=UPI003ECBA626